MKSGFRKCCYLDIMQTLKNGEENSQSSGRQKEDQICWKKRICQRKEKALADRFLVEKKACFYARGMIKLFTL